MSEALFSALAVDESTELTGYRLKRIQVLNWGTFDHFVWEFAPNGDTTLLTGDIGSGKSTIVDAITTLLFPSNRITYNKAAGGDRRERDLRSYVEGYYRSERDEVSGKSRPVPLRKTGSYSVLLAVFTNAGYDEAVTLAQVFWPSPSGTQPGRFFVSTKGELDIYADFSDFGTDTRKLRAKLRDGGAQISDAFPNYGRHMRQLLHIKSEQAMELFHQTVSMKSVQDLNEFVRRHMLEPTDMHSHISEIVRHYENLDEAHKLVERATAQLELLDPLVQRAEKYDEASAQAQALEEQKAALRYFFAELSIEKTREALEKLAVEISDVETDQTETQAMIATKQQSQQELILQRAEAGGDRLQKLESELRTGTELLGKRKNRREQYTSALRQAELPTVETSGDFRKTAARIPGLRAELERRGKNLQDQQEPLIADQQNTKREIEALKNEAASLAHRRNNLDERLVDLRARLYGELSLEEEALPFAGELIDVAPNHSQWRGAAERVLRPFARTLLVPETHYERVSRWVNDNNLKTRLVYLRVPSQAPIGRPTPSDEGLRVHDILEIEPGGFENYLQAELVRRADHQLVADAAALKHHDRAVTAAGLIRDRARHEKDDRFAITDPRHWLLGRSTESKIKAIEATWNELQTRQQNIATELQKLRDETAGLADMRDAFTRLESFDSWEEIDHETLQNHLAELQREYDEITAGSSQLAEINRKLDEIKDELRGLNERTQKLGIDLGRLTNQQETHQFNLAVKEKLINEAATDVLEKARKTYGELDDQLAGRRPQSISEYDAIEREIGAEIDANLRSVTKKITEHRSALEREMRAITARWPELEQEMDATIESLSDFRALQAQVKGDDLPRFEAEFKRLLNDESMKEIAGLNHALNSAADEIKDRVATINEALGAIDYNPGTIIKLEAENTKEMEIRDFRAQLREITADLTATDEISEARFEKVRHLIERFKGRQAYSEMDRRWLDNVTDVRNWFTFAASERSRETDEEHEHFTDADGKSGGQKEKLAYTILAASMAYQFGLEWGVKKSKDFRFAVIDEAFGRGSDESTRYALRLFQKLGLQLLIVTPLQKVNVIEPFVSAIGLVANPQGDSSQINTLSIEEYQERMAQGRPS